MTPSSPVSSQDGSSPPRPLGSANANSIVIVSPTSPTQQERNDVLEAVGTRDPLSLAPKSTQEKDVFTATPRPGGAQRGEGEEETPIGYHPLV